MATRGKTIKTETPQAQTLLRPMVTRRYELIADHVACCGCGTCATVCPHEAITMSEAETADGRLLQKPLVDIDPAKCSFCGECVVLCPTHALSMKVNGQEEVPVLKGNAFPMLIRKNTVAQGPCEATTDISYMENCPVGAISGTVECDANGEVVSVRDVEVDHRLCINCTRCMEEGPEGAFTVTKPYKGRTFLNTMLCPEGCQVCVDACPTNCITYDGEKVSLDQRFCLFCGACERACPVEGALRIVRTGFVHTPVESAAWARAVENLVSYKETVREYDVKGQAKRRKAAVDILLMGNKAAGS